MMRKWRGSMFYGLEETLTTEQEQYLDSIMSNRLTISNSVSGSGKTTLAVAMAHFQQKKLLYIFFPVEESEMGFRPGTQEEKESAYHGPLIDALTKIGENPNFAIKHEEEDVQWNSMASKSPKSKKEPWVEAKSHIFLRGTNIGEDGDTVIIVDEAQNGTKHQLKKILTRIHDKATVIVIGHTGQIDLKNQKDSGFERLIEHFSNKSYAKLCNLTKNFRGQLSRDADEM